VATVRNSSDDAKQAPQDQSGRRRATSYLSVGPSGATSSASSGGMGPSMLQGKLDRLDQLQIQSQGILRNQQNIA